MLHRCVCEGNSAGGDLVLGDHSCITCGRTTYCGNRVLKHHNML